MWHATEVSGSLQGQGPLQRLSTPPTPGGFAPGPAPAESGFGPVRSAAICLEDVSLWASEMSETGGVHDMQRAPTLADMDSASSERGERLWRARASRCFAPSVPEHLLPHTITAVVYKPFRARHISMNAARSMPQHSSGSRRNGFRICLAGPEGGAWTTRHRFLVSISPVSHLGAFPIPCLASSPPSSWRPGMPC